MRVNFGARAASACCRAALYAAKLAGSFESTAMPTSASTMTKRRVDEARASWGLVSGSIGSPVWTVVSAETGEAVCVIDN